jgi:hypothetical protein
MKTTSIQEKRFALHGKTPKFAITETPDVSLPAERPWTPIQIAAATFLFGVLGGSMCLAVNYVRLGDRKKAGLWAMAGILLTAGSMVLCWNVAGLGYVLPAVFGLGYMLLQKPAFQSWKARHWDSVTTLTYKPNKLGQLFVVAIAGCLFQLLVGLAAAAVLTPPGSW